MIFYSFTRHKQKMKIAKLKACKTIHCLGKNKFDIERLSLLV